jgi:hypothetical protein
VFYISGHVSYVFIYIHSPSGLRILEEPYKNVTHMALPLPPLPAGGGGRGGGLILAAWEILFPQKSGCEDDTVWVALCRTPLVFV